MVDSLLTLLLVLFAFAGSPANAGSMGADGTPVDEPAALALLAVGVVGLVIGRHAAKRRD